MVGPVHSLWAQESDVLSLILKILHQLKPHQGQGGYLFITVVEGVLFFNFSLLLIKHQPVI